MPFCPDCKYEYVEGIQKCADCGAKLVDHLPEEKLGGERIKWVPLRHFSGPIEAEMIREILENNEIPNLIQKDFLSSAYGAQGTSVGGLETVLFVPENQLQHSEELIAEISPPEDN